MWFAQVRIAQSSHYELKYTLGRKIVFICVARGNPRPQITWFKDGIELYAHNFFKVGSRFTQAGTLVFECARIAWLSGLR